jgi:hypothetical protein
LDANSSVTEPSAFLLWPDARLENGNRSQFPRRRPAPSSMNTRPWNFCIVTGEPLDRIRAGNTEPMVARVPQSGDFRLADLTG